jgi:hypothetical protein
VALGAVVLVALVALVAVVAMFAVVRPRPVAPPAVRAGDAPVRTGDRPGVDAPGSDVLVTSAGGTVLQVVERFVPVGRPAADLALMRPDLARVPSLRLRAPVVTDLSVTTDGEPQAIRSTASGWSLGGTAGRAVGQVTVRYRLTGAVVRDGGSASRRALVVVEPLTAVASMGGASAASAPVLVRVTPMTVHQAACLTAPPAEQLCGSAGSDGWVARLPASSAVPVVVFQVDLDA